MVVRAICRSAVCITAVGALVVGCNAGTLNPAARQPAGLSVRGASSEVRVASSGGFNVLYRFGGAPADGALPYGSLIGLNGMLYGTTYLGGTSPGCSVGGCGTFFSIDASGNEHVLYDFNVTGSTDGGYPESGPITLNGHFYGTLTIGGQFRNGAVYTADASGNETVVYSFKGGSQHDGSHPEAPLTALGGKLYGTTFKGGNSGCDLSQGCGTIFELTTDGVERVLHRFAGAKKDDGAQPDYSSDLVMLNGKLYGTTVIGGTSGARCGSAGCGTIYEVDAGGRERVLYRFTGGSDGGYPNGLTVARGALYGTTQGDGSSIRSIFFSITASGVFKTIGEVGSQPNAPLVYWKRDFYGTTVQNNGTVFKITPSGSKTVLHNFTGGSDGKQPFSPLSSWNGRLYGVTDYGGGYSEPFCNDAGCGTIFSVKP